MEITAADIAALLTVIIGLYLAKSTRNKAKTDAALAITEAAANIVKIREADIKALNKKYRRLRDYVKYLAEGTKALTTQLTEEGVKPVFEPKSLEEFQLEANNEKTEM